MLLLYLSSSREGGLWWLRNGCILLNFRAFYYAVFLMARQYARVVSDLNRVSITPELSRATETASFTFYHFGINSNYSSELSHLLEAMLTTFPCYLKWFADA